MEGRTLEGRPSGLRILYLYVTSSPAEGGPKQSTALWVQIRKATADVSEERTYGCDSLLSTRTLKQTKAGSTNLVLLSPDDAFVTAVKILGWESSVCLSESLKTRLCCDVFSVREAL